VYSRLLLPSWQCAVILYILYVWHLTLNHVVVSGLDWSTSTLLTQTVNTTNPLSNSGDRDASLDALQASVYWNVFDVSGVSTRAENAAAVQGILDMRRSRRIYIYIYIYIYTWSHFIAELELQTCGIILFCFSVHCSYRLQHSLRQCHFRLRIYNNNNNNNNNNIAGTVMSPFNKLPTNLYCWTKNWIMYSCFVNTPVGGTAEDCWSRNA